MGLSVISLFSGGGGLDLGLERAGFSTNVCVEWERYAALTLRKNQELGQEITSGTTFLQSAQILEQDIRHLSGTKLLQAAGLRRGQATLLAGGPPCVTFSIAGLREGLATDTGLLFREYVRLLRAARPQSLIFENVKGMLSARGSDGVPGSAFREIREAIAAEGYSLTWRVVNAADYGIPQFRERVIILGRRGSTPFEFPAPTHADPSCVNGEPQESWATVKDAIGDLPIAAPPRTEPKICNHVARSHGPQVIESFRQTPPGKRNPKYKRDRLVWDRPSKVIRAQGKTKSDGSGQKHSSHQSLHPDEPRQLTPRECARIQTFPDWYWLPPQFVNSYRIVGDAVPPLLGEALGRSILAQLEQETLLAA